VKVRVLERRDSILLHSLSFAPVALSWLENPETRCPADKAAVLVAAHKNLVGRSPLPPSGNGVVVAEAVFRWALTSAAYPTEVGGGIGKPEDT
jgi:hypothetical protein